MNKKGFTLVELLAAIVILSLIIVVVATKGFGAFNNTKNSIYLEQQSMIEESLNIIAIDIQNCIDSDNDLKSDVSELIKNFNNTLDGCSGSIPNCKCLKEHLSEGITIDYEKLKNSEYLVGLNVEELDKSYKPTNLYIKSSESNGKGSIIVTNTWEEKEETDEIVTNTYYVNYDTGNDTSNDGTSSTNALKTLKKAIELAGTSESTIILESDLEISLSEATIIPETITLKSNNSEQKEIVYNFAYTGSVQEFSASIGTYKLEVWGAQGGGSSSYPGSNGGYSKGIINLSSEQKLYVYVGGKGTQGKTGGGYNGGGNGTSTYNYGGGGSTDIRIHNGEWNDSSSLLSRIIVAGGGGGRNNSSSYTSGAGGGNEGIGATGYLNSSGGTQTAGGNSSIGTTSYTTYYNNSDFGIGAGGKDSVILQGFSGGGGGWYGGGCGHGASGGSGYVYTESSSSNYPEGSLLNSSYYLEEAETIAGNISFSSPTGESETGHSGDGYARITMLIS